MSNKRERYELNADPQFEDGEIIEVDVNYFGIKVSVKDDEYIEGVIVGRHEMGNNLAPYWIVDFGDKNWWPGMKYRTMVLPPCAICKRQEDLDEQIDLEKFLEELKKDGEEDLDEVIEESKKKLEDVDEEAVDEMIEELEQEEGENDFLPIKRVEKTNFKDLFRQAVSKKVEKPGAFKRYFKALK